MTDSNEPNGVQDESLDLGDPADFEPLTDEQRARQIERIAEAQAQFKASPEGMAPNLCKVLEASGRDEWPAFNDAAAMHDLFIAYYRFRRDPWIEWLGFFEAVNKLNGWGFNDERKWHDGSPGVGLRWQDFLDYCDHLANPEAWHKREVAAFEMDLRFQEIAANKLKAEAAKAAAKVAAAKMKREAADRMRAKRSKVDIIKRIGEAAGVARARAYEIYHNGTQLVPQQLRLAAAFADTPDRCTAAAWATKGNRHSRSFVSFLLSQDSEFDYPDMAKVREKYSLMPLGRFCRRPSELAILLDSVAAKDVDAYAVWAMYLQWRDQV